MRQDNSINLDNDRVNKKYEKILWINNLKSGISSKGFYEYLFTVAAERNCILTVVTLNGGRFELPDDLDTYNRIIFCGGDGTCNLVLRILHENKLEIPMGCIPSGSTNDYATNLGLPMNHLNACIDRAMGDNVVDRNYGLFNGKPFIYVAGIGDFVSVSYDTDQSLKNIFGRHAYMFSGLALIPNLRTYDFAFTLDSGERIERTVYVALFTNSNNIGGIPIGSILECSEDGFKLILLGYFDSGKLFEIYETQSLRIENLSDDDEICVTLDGEYEDPLKPKGVVNITTDSTFKMLL